MIKLSFFFVFTFLLFASCKNPVPSVNLVNSQDPDIILVNIENGDRKFICKVLLKIDSLNPILIGINVLFEGTKTSKEDSILKEALKKIDTDILPYGLNKQNEFESSNSIFTVFAKDKGFLKHERTIGLISNMTPIPIIEDEIHESFAYKIVKHWKPGFRPAIETNQQIPINYQRQLENFLRLDGSFLF